MHCIKGNTQETLEYTKIIGMQEKKIIRREYHMSPSKLEDVNEIRRSTQIRRFTENKKMHR